MKEISPVHMSPTKLEFLSVDPKEAKRLEEEHLEAEWKHREKIARFNHGVKAFAVAAFSFAFVEMFNIMNNRR